MKYWHVLLILFLTVRGAHAATFTMENYTGKDITVEIILDKKLGSKTQRATIAYGMSYRFDTGIYGVISGGIRWGNGKYYIDRFSIKPHSVGLVMRLFEDTYEFMYTGAWNYIKSGSYPQGEGRITKVK